jgi:uncharacterized membrane protein YhaH (DUF805 family)
MTSETFEQVLTAAQADGAFTPAWKKFVNTKFFVPVNRPAGGGPKDFTLHVAHEGGQSIQISEVRERLAPQQGAVIASLSGADVVRMLHPEAAILIALSDRAFRIAKERVEWLKKGIEASQAKAAARALEAAGVPATTAAVPAAHAAPMPVSIAKPEPAPAPVARKQGGVLDVAALKPRNVALPKIGLDFFVPSDWREIQNSKGLQFVDEASGTVVKASGAHRHDMSLAKWQEMNVALVAHEMRYLTQDGAPYAIDGDNWRDRIKGMATEFTGTFPGDDTPSRYLMACVRVEGTMALISIRAPAEQFEQNRALYKWLLSRIDLSEAAAIEQRAPVTSAAYDQHDAVEKPGPIGMSLSGRITRLQALAYSFPIWVPFVLIAILAAVIAPTKPVLGIGMVLCAFVVFSWLSARLMVLRLHDANISGKWLLYYVGLAIVSVVTRNPLFIGLVFGGGWLVAMVFYGLVPGTPDENDYGPQPDENSMLVKIGAFLFIMLQLSAIFGQNKMASSPAYKNPFAMGAKRGASVQSQMVTFMPPDASFMVDMPGTPSVLPAPPMMGRGVTQMYQLTTDDGAYLAQTIDFGRATIDHTGAMDALQKTVVEHGVLISSNTIILNGFKGREVRARMPDGLQRSSRYVIVGTKIRMVTIMTSASDSAADAKIEAFLTSFKLA